MNSPDPASVYLGFLHQSKIVQRKFLLNNRYFSIARFVFFIALLICAGLAFGFSAIWWWPAGALLISFIVLVVLNEQLIRRQRLNDSRITALEQEIEACKGIYSSFAEGTEFISHSHPFTTDLDIFGGSSLFQAINRSATPSGKQTLADWLSLPLTDPEKIASRQEAIQEIAGRPDWRIRLRTLGMVAGEGARDLDSLNDWLFLKPLFKSGLFRLALFIVPALSLTATVLLITGAVSVQLFLLFLLFPLGITGLFTKAINQRHMMLSRKVELLDKYSVRFRMIESEGLKSPFMLVLRDKLQGNGMMASDSIRKLGRITASLDTRLNLPAGLVLNFFLLWDIRQMIRLEQWQKQHQDSLARWFASLSDAEAVASLGAFAFNNPHYIYPEISPEKLVIRASGAGHPLIPASDRVNNDISITHRGHFNIITGANMAGKSTYLRTIGVNMVLALSGAPVCATSFSCYPAPVYTSLRTTDSLSSNQSYFYAELLRLKGIIDRLTGGEEMFVMLDEILKGTNSADKQAGSKALLTQLIGLGAAGFIATHDLELGNLIKSFPDDVTNYRFEAEIAGDELHFDYRLKPGIAQNMNATFLMKKMGITI